MSVTFENLTLCTFQTNPRLALAARRDVLDRPPKTSRGLRQVDRTRGQNATPSATAAPHFVQYGISPSDLNIWKFSLGLDRVTPYFWTAGRAKEGSTRDGQSARGGETCTPPLGRRFPRILLSAASRVKRLQSSCRRNMRSSSWSQVESSALIRHGGATRGAVDVKERSRSIEGAA